MLIDANLLLFAVDRASPFYERAERWLIAALTGTRRVGLPWAVLTAFLRISTHSRAFEQPLDPETALDHIGEWVDLDVVWIPHPTERHREVLASLITTHHIRGPLVTDAEIAALAIEHGLTVYSADSDFARFPEIRWENPLTAR